MNSSIHAFENEIAQARVELDAWLAEAYAGIEDQRFYGELDACYDGWWRVESLVGRVFDQALTQRLNGPSIDSLFFFFSRSEECGCNCKVVAGSFPDFRQNILHAVTSHLPRGFWHRSRGREGDEIDSKSSNS